MAMNAEMMLWVREALHQEYAEALGTLRKFGPDDAGDRGDLDWPYETFFRFEHDWQGQKTACQLTWRQWYRVLLDWAEEWDFDEFDETQHDEWEMAVGLSDGAPEIVVFVDYVEPVEAFFTPDEFWSLQRWCKACGVKLTDAQRIVDEQPWLAVGIVQKRA